MYWSKISTPKKTKKEEVPKFGNDSNMKISVRLIALLLVCMMLSVALVACTTVEEVVKEAETTKELNATTDDQQEYLSDNVVAFRQILIRAFDYVYETDTNGDDIYYLPSENNAKVNNIAYDNVKGSVRLDEYGKTLTDANGDDIFFLPDGKIAYDKVNGVRALSYDASGNPKTVKYSAEELAAHKADAEEILATVEAGDYAAFEALLAEYEAADDDAFVTDGTYCFLYTTGDNNYDYLNDIADTLAESEEGQIRMISSEYGYNVVMKYPMPADAAANTAYEDWFSDLSARTVAMLFNQKCSAYMEMVTVDEEAFATLPSMKDIGTNRAY